MKPILKYRGGKSKEIPLFERYIPTFETYFEPFFGGGALFFHIEPNTAVVNDVNQSLIRFYEDVKNNYGQLRTELDILQQIYERNRRRFEELKAASPDERVVDENEFLYYRIRDMFNGVIEREFLFGTIYYFINKTAYSGMVRYNSQGQYNVPYGRYKNFNTQLLTENHHRLLSRTEVLNGSYEESFRRADTSDFIFLDPPYDTIFSEYGNEAFTGDFGEQEHRQLAQDFSNLSCPTLMVISETPLITELYANFIKDSYEKNYAVNIRNRFNSRANHLVITNYQID